MLESTTRLLAPLPAGHPCQGCEARGHAICRILDCENLAQFKKLGSTLRLGVGQMLFWEGDPATRVFTLTRGSLKLCKLLPDGRRQVVGFMYAGDFLGISIDDEHAFSAELIEDAWFCCFSHAQFDDFLADHPLMVHELYRMAAHELSAAQQQLVLLGRKTATERLASFLLLLGDRADRMAGENTRFVDFPMSRGDIADYLGLTKETVSRIFSAFRADRLIRLRALNKVEILDRLALRQAAGRDD